MCKICVCFFSAEHNYCMLINQLGDDELGGLSKGDSNENGKKAIGLD